ncbi:hypothetical protein ACSV5M_19780 [Cellvibrio sp. ARAG 10.3]|uniref:hypothetical protein n=1 Tax=Cellvibrio sp. ARAG 10.3 TaxID=3451358 RepID=UPI003F464E97
MLDWLRYFPLALPPMHSLRYVRPKGPYFPKLRPQQWNLNGSKFGFKAPWSNSVYAVNEGRWVAESVSPGNTNVLATNLNFYPSSWMPNEHWQYHLFYSRKWYFVGPWFSGMRSWLSMTACVIGQDHIRDFANASFFHPKVFESAVADFLDSSYGCQKAGRKPLYCGPVNWKIIPISSRVNAALFDIHDIQSNIDNPGLTRMVIFPVTNKRLIKIEFNYGGTRINEENYDATPIFDLSDAIIETFHLETGIEMESQWTEVTAYCADMSLTQEFAPLRWPIKPEDVGKAEERPPQANRSGHIETGKVKAIK